MFALKCMLLLRFESLIHKDIDFFFFHVIVNTEGCVMVQTLITEPRDVLITQVISNVIN